MSKLILDPDKYIPPQITETWGESQYIDCTWAAGYGAVDIWTTGAVTRDINWRPYGQARLKAEREALREASGDLTGGSTLMDLARGVEAYWPQLPALRTSTPGDPGGVSWSYQELHAKCADGWSALLQGNPSRIQNQSSFLRTAQNNDDYDHSVLGVRVRANGDWLVMDPLRPWTSKPRWVPSNEIEAFLTRFTTSTGNPYYAVVNRGAQSALGLAQLQIKALKLQLKGKPASCDDVVAAARAQGIADAAAAAAAVK